jgi:hypothetical protein
MGHFFDTGKDIKAGVPDHRHDELEISQIWTQWSNWTPSLRLAQNCDSWSRLFNDVEVTTVANWSANIGAHH